MSKTKPFLINFKKICLEKTLSLLNRFLLYVSKQRFNRTVFELFFVKKAVNIESHLSKIKKLKFLKISLKIICFFS